MSINNALKSPKARVFLLNDKSVRDGEGLNKFNAYDNVGILDVYIEDGDNKNIVSLNYSPSIRTDWSSHEFPLFFVDYVNYTLEGETIPRSFAQFRTFVPYPISSLNINGKSAMQVGVTVTQVAGTTVLGAFENLETLKTEYPASEELYENEVVAFVLDLEEIGYYMVKYDNTISNYVWYKNESGEYLGYIYQKQYNQFDIFIQPGGANPKPITKISDLEYRMIWQQLNIINGLCANLQSQIDDNLEDFLDLKNKVFYKDGSEKATGDFDLDKHNINGIKKIETQEISSDLSEILVKKDLNINGNNINDVENINANKLNVNEVNDEYSKVFFNGQAVFKTSITGNNNMLVVIGDILNMYSGQIKEVLKGTSINDVATLENLYEHITVEEVEW